MFIVPEHHRHLAVQSSSPGGSVSYTTFDTFSCVGKTQPLPGPVVSAPSAAAATPAPRAHRAVLSGTRRRPYPSFPRP